MRLRFKFCLFRVLVFVNIKIVPNKRLLRKSAKKNLLDPPVCIQKLCIIVHKYGLHLAESTMKRSSIFDLIQVNARSATPKYLQLTKSILNAIDAGKIEKGALLPSINELSFELDISRRTAEKGYAYLKNIGVLGSVPGKAFFIKRLESRRDKRIILLFNKLSVYKKMIYDSFVNSLGENASIDLYIYNNDYGLFRKLLSEKKDEYSFYVIIPFFQNGGPDAYEIINTIPKDKLILLDRQIDGITGCYAAALENFENDIYYALNCARERLAKYNTIKIIFPKNNYYSSQILRGLYAFCRDFGFNCQVIDNIQDEPIRAGEVYINVMDDDLVLLIEKLKALHFKVGEEIGIISYNESPLKRIILNGITTISTDFYQMGKMAAKFICNHSKEHLTVPFHLTMRESL